MIKITPDTKDIWQALAELRRPVLLYGSGNGADKILDECIRREIEVLGVFASNGFVAKSSGARRSFRGMPILSYEEAIEQFSSRDPAVLLCFASRLPDVIGNISKIAAERDLFVPDVPVVGEDELFTADFARKNVDKIECARNLLADEESRRIYDGVIEGKLTGSLAALLDASSDMDTVFTDILPTDKYRTYADLGAYNGDTLKEALDHFENLCRAYTVEPDPKTYKKLLDRIGSLSELYPGCEMIPYNTAAWNKRSTLYFCGHGNRGSSGFRMDSPYDEKSTPIAADSLDDILEGEGVDYIKFDVEGAEREALEGCRSTIERYRPDLCISLYHRSSDIFDLPLMLEKTAPGYTMYLRRVRCLPAWEINLYAVKK